MKTIAEHTIDKSSWGEGPWQHEPDKVQWQDEATGLPCLIVRHHHYGHWCGYVGVSKGHKFFEKEFNEVEEAGLSVHGDLTYSDFCVDIICHVVEHGDDDHVWWLGFDCGHFSIDISPGMEAMFDRQIKEFDGVTFPGRVYRDMEYVKREVTNLARQLADIK